MNYQKLEEILQRADRFRNKLQVKDGDGMAWTYSASDGQKCYYSFSGVKPPEVLQDELESAFVWLWSLKDYVQKYAVIKGRSKRWVETEVNVDPYLCICADIANSAKHGGLDRKPRSNKEPVLGSVKYTIPQSGIEKLTIGQDSVFTDIYDPAQIKLEWPIIGKSNKYLGDAFKYLEYSLKAWEKIIYEADKAI